MIVANAVTKIWFVLAVCSQTGDHECKNVAFMQLKPQSDTELVQQCMLDADRKIDEWKAKNPGWRVMGWQCTRGDAPGMDVTIDGGDA